MICLRICLIRFLFLFVQSNLRSRSNEGNYDISKELLRLYLVGGKKANFEVLI